MSLVSTLSLGTHTATIPGQIIAASSSSSSGGKGLGVLRDFHTIEHHLSTTSSKPLSAAFSKLLTMRTALAEDRDIVNTDFNAATSALREISAHNLVKLTAADKVMLASALLLTAKIGVRDPKIIPTAADFLLASANLALYAQSSPLEFTGEELFQIDRSLAWVQISFAESLEKGPLSAEQVAANADVLRRVGMARGSQRWEVDGLALQNMSGALTLIYPGIGYNTIARAQLYILPSDYFGIASRLSESLVIGLEEVLAISLEGPTDKAIRSAQDLYRKHKQHHSYVYVETLREAMSDNWGKSRLVSKLIDAVLDSELTKDVRLSLSEFLNIARQTHKFN